MGFSSKKPDSVTRNYIWAPNTMKKLEKEVSEKTNEPVSGKTYGQTEGRTDPIIGPF